MFRRWAKIVCALSLLPAHAFAQDVPASRPEEKATALLLIDIQDFYFPGGAVPLHEPEAAARNAARLLERFRAEGRPVVHVGHKAKAGIGFHAAVAPREGEKILYKSEVSAFNGTELLAHLRDLEVERLVIAGMQTHMCVEAAVRAAHDLGFECVLVGDACATRNLTYEGLEVSAADVHASTLATLDRTYAKVVDTETYLAAR